jgi:transcriptional regulator with XRE-family HTH domain
MSLRELAAAAHCSKTHVADLESGRRSPTLPIATALDKALGANGDLVAMVDIGPRAVVWPETSMDALPPLAALLTDPRRYVDGSVVDDLSSELEASKAADGTLGPAAALPKVQAVLSAVQHAVREVNPHRDLRDLPTATYWYDRAIEWAQEADDAPMQSYVLVRKSQLAYDRQDPLKVLTLAEAAQHSSTRLPAGVRAEVLQQQALGLAMLGEPVREVEIRLEEARELLPRISQQEPGTLGSYFTEHMLLLRSTACFTEAGKPAKAAEILGAIIASGSLSYRDVGYFQARHAAALALIGEPDEAAALGLAAARVARATRSGRTTTVLGDMLQSMDRWRRRPQVRALHDFLADRPGA